MEPIRYFVDAVNGLDTNPGCGLDREAPARTVGACVADFMDREGALIEIMEWRDGRWHRVGGEI